ncbi:MAG: MCP four helix bundle domain-containing protein, partial [Marinoscillum sp.]
EQKSNAALALGIIFILMLGTNMLDTQHANELKSSFSSFYKDRLLVEGYIYEMSGLMHQKEMNLKSANISNNADWKDKNGSINSSMNSLMEDYEKTKLTELEVLHFDNLRQEFAQLTSLEQQASPNLHNAGLMKEISAQYHQISMSLDNLSQIQISEGQNILNNSNRIFASEYLTSQLEFGVLIIIGLILQALVFASKTIMPKFPQQSSLN